MIETSPTRMIPRKFSTLMGRYASQEQRVGLMQELDHYHDCMKTLLNLHLDPANDPRLKLIILN